MLHRLTQNTKNTHTHTHKHKKYTNLLTQKQNKSWIKEIKKSILDIQLELFGGLFPYFVWRSMNPPPSFFLYKGSYIFQLFCMLTIG